MALLYCAVV